MQSKVEAVAFAIDSGWLDDAGAHPVDRWVEQVDDEQLLAALRELPPDQRGVLLLRTLWGADRTGDGGGPWYDHRSGQGVAASRAGQPLPGTRPARAVRAKRPSGQQGRGSQGGRARVAAVGFGGRVGATCLLIRGATPLKSLPGVRHTQGRGR